MEFFKHLYASHYAMQRYHNGGRLNLEVSDRQNV